MPKIIVPILVSRFCAEGAPLGVTENKIRNSPSTDIEMVTESESHNLQTTEKNAHSRTRKDSIKVTRTYPYFRFKMTKKGVSEVELNEIIANKLYGAFKEVIPEYLNSVTRSRIHGSTFVYFKAREIGKIESKPVEDAFEMKGRNKGMSWRYVDVLDSVKGEVTFENALLQQNKFNEYVGRTLAQRIGKLHAVYRHYGVITRLDKVEGAS